MPTQDRSSPVMGTIAKVVVVDTEHAGDLLDHAHRRLVELEQRWSRFLPTSEVARLNAAHGQPTEVSNDTVVLLQRAQNAWRLTGGAFNPTVLDAVVHAGYTATFAAVATRPQSAPVMPLRRPAAGLDDLTIEGQHASVPPGVRLDPGAIGKGLAADLVATDLMRHGACGALVDVGGDLRALGTPPDAAGWGIEVEDHTGAAAARLALAHGGVATTTPARRRWRQQREGILHERHHLIDPMTGEPAAGPLRSVTIIAGEAWLAEVLATATYLRGPGELLAAHDATGLITVGDHIIALPGLEQYLR